MWLHNALHVVDKVFAFCSILGLLFWGAYHFIFSHKDDRDPPPPPPGPTSTSGRNFYLKDNRTGKRYKIILIQAFASIAAGGVEVKFGPNPWLTYGTFSAITACAALHFHFTNWHWRKPPSLEQQAKNLVREEPADDDGMVTA